MWDGTRGSIKTGSVQEEVYTVVTFKHWTKVLVVTNANSALVPW